MFRLPRERHYVLRHGSFRGVRLLHLCRRAPRIQPQSQRHFHEQLQRRWDQVPCWEREQGRVVLDSCRTSRQCWWLIGTRREILSQTRKISLDLKIFCDISTWISGSQLTRSWATQVTRSQKRKRTRRGREAVPSQMKLWSLRNPKYSRFRNANLERLLEWKCQWCSLHKQRSLLNSKLGICLNWTSSARPSWLSNQFKILIRTTTGLKVGGRSNNQKNKNNNQIRRVSLTNLVGYTFSSHYTNQHFNHRSIHSSNSPTYHQCSLSLCKSNKWIIKSNLQTSTPKSNGKWISNYFS